MITVWDPAKNYGIELEIRAGMTYLAGFESQGFRLMLAHFAQKSIYLLILLVQTSMQTNRQILL